jgi:hypothetical protein
LYSKKTWVRTGLHAGKTPPGVERKAIDETADEAADDEDQIGVFGVNVGSKVPDEGGAEARAGVFIPLKRDIGTLPARPKTGPVVEVIPLGWKGKDHAVSIHEDTCIELLTIDSLVDRGLIIGRHYAGLRKTPLLYIAPTDQRAWR